MSGSSSGENQLSAASSQSEATSQQLLSLAQQRYAKADSLNAPLVGLDQSIIGGNSTATQQALAPAIAAISKSTEANKEQIMDSTGPGAARDNALAQNQLTQGSEIAGTTNQNWLQAFQSLSNIAGQQYGVAATQLGGGLSSENTAVSASGQLAQNQSEGKASTMGFLGQLAGAAGTAAAGFSGGGSGAPEQATYGQGGAPVMAPDVYNQLPVVIPGV